MTNQVALNATTNRLQGSRENRRLRRTGQLPGVVYGLGGDAQSVAVNYREARSALTTDAGLNAILNLDVDGDQQLCIVKEVQRHPVRDEVIHVDFLRVDPNVEVEVDVPIVLAGEAKEVANEDGMIDQALFSISVFAKPMAIPNELEVDISAMAVGDSIRVGDVDLPEGVRAATDPDEAVAVAVVTRSTIEAMAAEEAAEAAAEAAEDGGAAAPKSDGEEGGGDEG